MKQHISIDVDLDSLEQNNSKNIVGKIVFTIDYHKYFPDPEWSDFVVIVLTWWIKSLKGLMISNPNVIYEFNFMDGPPVILAKRINDKDVLLFFCEDTTEKRVVLNEVVCTIAQLRTSLLKVSKQVIRATRREKWKSEDIENLEDLVRSLERSPSH
jgi:hypothetical protein